MTATTLLPKPPALLTTPTENTECPRCEVPGIRYPGTVAGRCYAHCPECGTTDLLDCRSPWEVLAEAEAHAAEARRQVPEARGPEAQARWAEAAMDRQDLADRVRQVAEAADAVRVCECMDCTAWRPRA